jgi:hypothetical protein
MGKREPELDLLLRGELLSRSPLSYEEMRQRMLATLRDRLPLYTLRAQGEPGIAIIEALAACLDVMGFYHDRILTEARIGSALRLESVAKLGAVVGYRPAPPLAAVTYQFFLAAASGLVLAGTRVAGRGGDPPKNVVFETRAAISIAPAYNRMELSPLLTRYAGALRVILRALSEETAGGDLKGLAELAARQDSEPAALPLDDFRAGTLAIINSKRGLELCPVAGSRRGGVAFERPLLRSYDEQTTLARATRIRHLRFPRALGGDLDPALVVFEVTDRPILHVPDPAAPEVQRSTLEVYVFDTPVEVSAPEAWDPKAAWTEVSDFSASEVSDRHYRTFVDDRLTTYIILRRKLGFRVLLDDAALERVYVRYAAALGRVGDTYPEGTGAVNVPAKLPSAPIWGDAEPAERGDLNGSTMGLDRAYFETAMVRPAVADTPIRSAAGWAVTKEKTGLTRGDQIAVLGGSSGDVFFRTLVVDRERYLRWTVEPRKGELPPGIVMPRPADEHEPIPDVFDPAKGAIAPIAEVASGQDFPLWDAFYKQAHWPTEDWALGPVEGTEIPSSVTSASVASLEQYIYLHKGSTFLLLHDSSHVKSGDYLLVGRRLKGAYRNPPPGEGEGSEGGGSEGGGSEGEKDKAPLDGEDEEGLFSTHAPWLTAEVVQAVEVQGNMVRLKEPISQDYYLDREPGKTDPITEIIVVPRVASVYYGDHFTQDVKLTTERTFIDVGSAKIFYVNVKLSSSLGVAALHEKLGVTGQKPSDIFAQLFLAISGEVAEAPTSPQPPSWEYLVTIPRRGLNPSHVGEVRHTSDGVVLSSQTSAVEAQNANEFELKLAGLKAAQDVKKDPSVTVIVTTDEVNAKELTWTATDDKGSAPPPVGTFRVVWPSGSYFLPQASPSPPVLNKDLLKSGGTLVINSAAAVFKFTWTDPQSGQQPRGLSLELESGQAPTSGKINALALSTASSISPSTSATWFTTWTLPSDMGQKLASSSSNVKVIAFVRADGASREYYCKIASNKIELPDVLILPDQPLDPISGAKRVWALPTKQLKTVQKSAVSGVWRFKPPSSPKTVLGSSWQGALAVMGGPDVVLRTNVDSGSDEIRAKLPGNTIDLRVPNTSIHALHASPPNVRQTQTIWHWVSPAPLEAPSPIRKTAALTFLINNVASPVVRASIWWDDAQNTLRLIPEQPQPAITGTQVDQIVELHPEPFENASVTPLANEQVLVSLSLPLSWPVSEQQTKSTKRVLVKNKTTSTETIYPVVNVKLTGQQLELTVKQLGALAPKAGDKIFLVLRDWSDQQNKTVAPVSALYVEQPFWTDSVITKATYGGLFFTPASLDGAGDVISIPQGTTFIDKNNIVVKAFTGGQGALLFAPKSASNNDALPLNLASVYLSLLSAAAVTPKGSTNIQLPPPPLVHDLGDPGNKQPNPPVTSASIPDRDKLRYMGVRSQDTWSEVLIAPASWTGDTDTTLEFPTPLPDVFKGGLPDSVTLRFAYDIVDAVGACSSAELKATVPTAKIPTKEKFQGMAVALYNPSDLTTILGFTSFDINSDLLTSTIKLTVNPSDVFSSASQILFSALTIAQSFTNLDASSISEQPLQIELGPAPLPEPPGGKVLELAVDDVLSLDVGQGALITAPITAVIETPSSAYYQLAKQKSPTSVRLRSLRVTASSFRTLFSMAVPQPRQEPWLLTFSPPSEQVSSISGSILRYTGAPTEENSRISFRFDGATTAKILEAGSEKLYFYTNQVEQLASELYLWDAPTYLDPDNFLKLEQNQPDKAVTALFAREKARSFAPNDQPNDASPKPRVLLASKTGLPPEDAGELIERGTEDRTRQEFHIPVLSQSIVFNSGNFIPVLGTLATHDDKVIRNALRVRVHLKGEKEAKLVTYNRRLSEIVEAIEQQKSSYPYEGKQYFYSFNKVPSGAFTLNFLLIGEPPEAEPRVTVYVEYFADLAPPGDKSGRLYQFETPLERVEVERQLVLLDSGDVKVDDYLFLHTALDPDAPDAEPNPIYWTRVSAVEGPVVRVAPDVPFNLDAFRGHRLTGFAKPPKPAALDKEYYARLKSAVLTPSSPTLILGDRLVFDPEAGKVLLSALVPGDRLLIWDEDYRLAWSHHRLDRPAPGSADWSEWPDRQHEAVVKQVDADTGLVVLTEPLPDRFLVSFTVARVNDSNGNPIGHALTPNDLTLRALPHYRAPFQGTRRMTALGSGEKSRRFARFTTILDADPGLATLPLAQHGVYASNIEVLALEPRSKEWTRWSQFADIDRAARKDRGFVLGVDPASVGGGGRVPLSASFGDGITGQTLPTGERNVFVRWTELGGWLSHTSQRWRLRVVSIESYSTEDTTRPFEVPPEAAAARDNLKLIVETGAPEQWSPAAGQGQWRPALEVRVNEEAWREVSEEQARLGFEGYYVRGHRPGAVEIFFFSRRAVTSASVAVWKVPEARVWTLDRAFYDDLAQHDLTRAPGARRLALLETEGLGPGSLLALSPGEEGPLEVVEVAEVDPDTWSATLTKPLSSTYALGRAFVRGNIVKADQGDTERVTLGGSDGSTRNLRLPLYNRAPLLHLVTEDSTDPEPAITVSVSGAPWSRVADLGAAGPRDRVFRLDIEADGGASVLFGDGLHGAVPPPGTNNIEAAIRAGDGEAGNLPAGAVNKLRDGNLAVKATWNITAAAGGRPAETAGEARETLLGRNVGYHRVVSRDDVARVALEVGEVLHARLDPTASSEALTLIVALAGRRAPTQEVLDLIRDRIVARMPATACVTVEVRGAKQVPVDMLVEVTTAPSYRQGDVLAALARAFSAGAGGFFAVERWPVGEPLRLGDVYEAIFAVPGVARARVARLITTAQASPYAGPVPDSINPGPDGVIRCDTDALNDPTYERGSTTFMPSTGGGAT